MKRYIHKDKIGIVDEYVYLGQLKTPNAKMTGEINRGYKMAWSSLGRLNFILKSKLPLDLTHTVYNECVLPVMITAMKRAQWTRKRLKDQELHRAEERCRLKISR